MTHPERVYSRTQLLDQVWGDHVFVEERTVDVHIRRLRKALEPSRPRPPDPDRARRGLSLFRKLTGSSAGLARADSGIIRAGSFPRATA